METKSSGLGLTEYLEEESGKSVHSGTGILDSSYSLLDYNRSGIPLIEIVSEPDLRSPQEAADSSRNSSACSVYPGYPVQDGRRVTEM